MTAPRSITGTALGIQRLMIVLILVVKVVHPVYLPPEESLTTAVKANKVIGGPTGKTAEGGGGGIKERGSFFRDDSDVSWYLKIFNRKVMIWRCKNAIQKTMTEGQSLPFLDLSCSVIGKLWSVSWHHGKKEIATKTGKLGDVDHHGHYSLSISPHVDGRGHSFSNWNNARLRIHNATSQDSGLYLFVVTHWDGPSDRQKIYVDIGERKFKRHHSKDITKPTAHKKAN